LIKNIKKYRGPVAKLQVVQKFLHGDKGVLQFPVPKNYTFVPLVTLAKYHKPFNFYRQRGCNITSASEVV